VTVLPTGSQSSMNCEAFYVSIARPSPILSNPVFAILLTLFCLRYLSLFVATKGAKFLKYLDLFNCRLSCILCQIFGCRYRKCNKSEDLNKGQTKRTGVIRIRYDIVSMVGIKITFFGEDLNPNYKF